jgi:hypothetical protein
VFFDSKGRSSYVKWIGDIRTPKCSDKDSVTTGGLTEYDFRTFINNALNSL